MTSGETGAPCDRESGRGRFLIWAVAAGCLFVMVWMGLGWSRIRSRDTYVGKKTDYYSSQVHGFLSGHLYMDKEGYPEWASPDPAIRAKVAYVLDASYYRGRFYLYFGVTPAALFLLPYAWLTGSDVDPRFIVVLCAAVGFLFSVGILKMAARDHFGRMGAWFTAAAVASLAFASAVPSLLTRAMFYEVAIATGYAFTMAGAFWTYRAVSGRRRPCLQLALASFTFGLAVGCRPDLVLNMPVLAAAAFSIGWKARKNRPLAGALLRTGAAAVLPAACVGAFLAIYNYERFGDPLEFGLTYSMNFFAGHGKPIVSAAYLWPNLHWYYLTLPALSPFFPYVFPEGAYFGPPEYRWGEVIHGQFPVLILGAFVAAAALLSWRQLRIGRLASYLALLAWMFLVLLLAISAFGYRGDRYMVDFQPSLVLGIVLMAYAIASATPGGAGARIWRLGFIALAALASVFNVFAGLQDFDAFKNLRAPTFQALEGWGNYPAYWLEKLHLLQAGPVELKVVFPTNHKVAVIEPLLAAGTPEFSDSLNVIESPSGAYVEFLGDHSGFGGPRSEQIPVTPGQTYTLTIDMGALYPPLSPPFISDFNDTQSRLLKTGIRVEMDGKTVLDRKMRSYDAPPWTVEVGRNDITMNPFETRFSGRVLSVARLPPPQLMENENNGLWRISCDFPMERPNTNFPLLSSGITGSGTLIYLNVLPGNRVRFGVDEWGYGGGFSEALEPPPGSGHVVEILIGPLAWRAKWPKEWGNISTELGPLEHSLRVWLDGRPVWTTELHHPVSPLAPMFDVGANRQGFTTAEAEYPGAIRSRSYTPGEAREFLDRNFRKNP
jgi:hypothetical protein